MCFFKMPKQQKLQESAPPPELSDPSEVGSKRKEENDQLFGGIPALRVDRSANKGIDDGDGSGLNLMK